MQRMYREILRLENRLQYLRVETNTTRKKLNEQIRKINELEQGQLEFTNEKTD